MGQPPTAMGTGIQVTDDSLGKNGQREIWHK